MALIRPGGAAAPDLDVVYVPVGQGSGLCARGPGRSDGAVAATIMTGGNCDRELSSALSQM
jgi:hypothetical protein